MGCPMYPAPCNCDGSCMKGLKRGLAIWIPISAVIWICFAALLLAGCASDRELFLQGIKDGVDNRMMWVHEPKKIEKAEYLGGGDGLGGCSDFVVTYLKDAKSNGVSGHTTICYLDYDQVWHAAFVTTDGWVMDNRSPWVYEGRTCR